VDLRRPRELAEGVPDEDAARDLVAEDVARVRKDGGHARANAVALDDREVADAHPGDVGDRVEGAGRKDAGGQADVTGARAGLRPRGGDDGQCGHRSYREGDGGRGSDQRACHGRPPSG
jgi:hypothetical protein